MKYLTDALQFRFNFPYKKKEFEHREEQVHRHKSTRAHSSPPLPRVQISRAEASEGSSWSVLLSVPFSELKETLGFTAWIVLLSVPFSELQETLGLTAWIVQMWIQAWCSEQVPADFYRLRGKEMRKKKCNKYCSHSEALPLYQDFSKPAGRSQQCERMATVKGRCDLHTGTTCWHFAEVLLASPESCVGWDLVKNRPETVKSCKQVHLI